MTLQKFNVLSCGNTDDELIKNMIFTNDEDEIVYLKLQGYKTVNNRLIIEHITANIHNLKKLNELEKYIFCNPHIAYSYAVLLVKTERTFDNKNLSNKLSRCEDVILNNSPYFSVMYARDIIKGRWKEAEPIILTDSLAILIYVKEVLKSEWVEGKCRLSPDYLERYLDFFKKDTKRKKTDKRDHYKKFKEQIFRY